METFSELIAREFIPDHVCEYDRIYVSRGAMHLFIMLPSQGPFKGSPLLCPGSLGRGSLLVAECNNFDFVTMVILSSGFMGCIKQILARSRSDGYMFSLDDDAAGNIADGVVYPLMGTNYFLGEWKCITRRLGHTYYSCIIIKEDEIGII